MSRLSALLSTQLTAEQQAVLDAIVGGKRGDGRALGGFLDQRGAMRGPFNAMLHRPDLGLVLQRLGEILRFEARLPAAQREIAILVVASHWRARYEWWAHARIAREAGVAEATIEAIRRGAAPHLDEPASAAIHAFAAELVGKRRVCDATYERAVDALGEAVVVELVVLLGYYSCISMVLNAFEVALPPGEMDPFEDDREGVHDGSR